MKAEARFLAALAAVAAWGGPVAAQQIGQSPSRGGPAVGSEVFMATDSEKTAVTKILTRALWTFDGADDYQGIAVERAWFKPQGDHARRQNRFYLDLADHLGSKWRWRARVGTNGHTALGSASLRANDWSKELFAEREIVETREGLAKGIYYTFVGGSFDIPASHRDVLSLTSGLQAFTGRNERLHLRGSYVHVVAPKLGLTVQLRGRYFYSTVPGEFDYYSPREFGQLLPVVQMRRFSTSGWMFLAAFGFGAQRATGSKWQAARLLDLRAESPSSSRELQAFGEIQYSNSSLAEASPNYSYVFARAGLTARFR